MNKAIQKVDDMIGLLVSGIEQRKLGSCVNIIIVSDHGKYSELRFCLVASQISNGHGRMFCFFYHLLYSVSALVWILSFADGFNTRIDLQYNRFRYDT